MSGLIAGVDEAGRGPLAGPVCVAAVILDPARTIDGLDDSKQLSERRREALYPLIVERGLTGVQAMMVSAKAVWNNLAGMAGLFGVGFVVAIVGYLMLCVGLYLVLPLIMMAQAVAFRKIFPKIDTQTA